MTPRIFAGPLVLLAALALLTPQAAAAPPPGYECVGGYNPSALSNICYKITSTSYTPGSVGTSPMQVCVIGTLCPQVPVPTYDPDGGTPISIPGFLYHVEILGIGPCSDEQQDQCYTLFAHDPFSTGGSNEVCTGVSGAANVEVCQQFGRTTSGRVVACQAVATDFERTGVCVYQKSVGSTEFCVGFGSLQHGTFEEDQAIECL